MTKERQKLPEKSQRPVAVAVSGVKNSGKTTMIAALLPRLRAWGWNVAVIKHDGHDFEPDVPGTDTWIHRRAGAYGTAIFSGQRMMIVKEAQVTERELWEAFPEADLILLEGMKHSPYPKIELVREGNSEACVCDPATLLAVATNRREREGLPEGIPVMDLEDYEGIAALIRDYVKACYKRQRQVTAEARI